MTGADGVYRNPLGKSSLLNSLLDYKHLAYTVRLYDPRGGEATLCERHRFKTDQVQNNGGKACTSVVTEYCYHGRDDFVVEISVFSASELKAQFSEMVEAYRHYHYHRGDLENNDEEYWAKRATLASHTLGAMFGRRFTETDLLLSGDSRDEVAETLLGWATELGPGTADQRHVIASAEECSDLLRRLIPKNSQERRPQRLSEEEPAVWPYIQKIRFVAAALREGRKRLNKITGFTSRHTF